MKLSVIDADYQNPKHIGLAVSWLKYHLSLRGIDIVSVEESDFVLVSTTSQQRYPSVRNRLKKLKGYKKIIIGGSGAFGPAVFDGIADVVCVGEGLRFINTLIDDGFDAVCNLSESWVPGDTNEVIPGTEFPWDIPPIMHPDGRYRLFESRGCKHKCLFCQTGWERKYTVNPDLTRLVRQCHALNRMGHKFDIVTNDAGVTGIINGLSGSKLASYRYKYLKNMDISNIPQTVRIGVEGVSERLRRAVNKPVPNDGLIELVHKLFSHGRTVRLFFIVGLPLEEESDYDELGYLINGIGRANKGLAHITFHAFIPQPASPLCIFPLVDEYWEREEYACRRFFDGDWFTRRVNWSKPAQYKTRLKNAKNSMAATEHELRRGWWFSDNPNWRVRYVASPWKMRHLSMCYARKLGREDVIPDGVITKP